MSETMTDPTPPKPERFAAAPMSVADLLGLVVDQESLTEALREVIDPELGVNVVDLGLVYDAQVTDGVAHILITTTTPACPLGPYLTDAIRWSLLRLDGILDVDIEVTYDPLWSPDRMTDLAKEQLGWRR
jgi:metal-sulfur cluster biosynthetic enzyme